MKIELTQELLNKLSDPNNIKISKKDRMVIIDDHKIHITKLARKFLHKNGCCSICKKQSSHIELSKSTKNINGYNVHTIDFICNDVKLIKAPCNNRTVCQKCADKNKELYDVEQLRIEQKRLKEHEEMLEAWYDYKDELYEVADKNNRLVYDLMDSRETFCGIGTRKVKLKLNKLIKENNNAAKILRSLLELEDANISAKKYVGKYRTRYYDKKSELLKECIELFKENNLVHGFQPSNNYSCNYVIYFEFNDVQFSWHSNNKYGLIKYLKPWDGLENSTLGKLEKLIKDLLTFYRML